MGVHSNFGFLGAQDERLARLGALAERYFFDEAPSSLIKLRQLAEFLAKEVAARHGLLPKNNVTFDEVLRTLRLRAILPRDKWLRQDIARLGASQQRSGSRPRENTETGH